MDPRKSRRALLCAAFLSLFSSYCYAQGTATAQLAGNVTDPTGAPVAGVAVKLTETERGVTHQAVSEADGRYTLPDLPVAAYTLTATVSGFKSFTQTRIVLHVGDNRELNIPLQIGDVSQNVEVVGGANLVQTEQTSVSQIISQKNIVDLPLNGRQPTQLVLISGAAVVTPPGDMATTKNYFSSTTISVGGGQGNGTNYLLDGGDNVDTMTNVNLPFPFPDALQEFAVDTNALPARNGRQPGGLVSIITKSGGNSYHGDAFEFLRNGDLNARNAFSINQDTLKRNQFGGTFGGKIIKDKLFFFFGYQGTRIVSQSNSAIAYVPTPLELQGNFTVQESAACQSSHSNKTLTGYPGNSIPVTQLDQAAVKLATYLPTTSNPCGQLTYGVHNIQNEDQGIGRIDYSQSAKHNLFGRYFIAKYLNPAPFDPKNFLVTAAPGLSQSSHSFTLGDTYTFTPSVLNSFRGTFSRRTDYRGPAAGQINARTLGININPLVPNDFRLSVSNDFNVGCGTCSPGYFNVNTFSFADDVDYIVGKHHLAFGAEFVRTQNNLLAGYLQNGNFAFNGTVTSDPMADFLLGAMSTFSQSLPQQPTTRQSIPEIYAQDTVRLTPQLVLNAGVRWEPTFYPSDHWHRGTQFSLANFLAGVHSTVYPTAPAGSLFYGDPGVPAAFTSNHLLNFSPRLGLAFDPKGDGKQILRVGAAIMYDTPELYLSQRNASDPPFANEVDLNTSAKGGFSNPWTTGYNYPGGNPFPPTGTYFPQYALWIENSPNIKPMTLTQWNLTYQRQLGNDWVVSGSYFGNKTTHLPVGAELNPALNTPAVCAQFTAGCTSGNTNPRRRFVQLNPSQGQYYGNVDQVQSAANAEYNALLLSANHRLTRGISVLVNYTWSHCISNVDFGGDITGPSFSNPSNLAQDRGDCNFDIRHIFNLAVVGTTPSKGDALVRAIIGGWQFSPIVRALSGEPLNVVTGSDRSLVGTNLDRPNLISGVNPYSSGQGPLQYLNPLAFTPNPLGTFGNLGRDALRGPRLINIDLALSRIFNLHHESAYRLEVRGEAFNIINRVNYIAAAVGTGIPGISTSGINLSNPAGSTFGRITSSGDPRIMQVAMKLYF